MNRQTFANHVKFYTPHHFVFYPLLLGAISASIYKYNQHPDQRDIWMALIALFIFTGWSSFMMRQHYALENQDRIIRLELRFRYFLITGRRLELFEDKLRISQLVALRFASDEELSELIDRAMEENLSSRQIKKSIRHWVPDYMRV
jgi:hypothetical protein